MEGERDADGKFTFINSNGDDVTATDEDYKGYKVGFPSENQSLEINFKQLFLLKTEPSMLILLFKIIKKRICRRN